ncbi:Pao retrotransposon peptidase [Popillia japonica]|uniref:Pao retrotransposon peptidase n=1 Tax=Popillia japonica TaxID=7064 RepID=A0AAW1I8R0_POPJA
MYVSISCVQSPSCTCKVTDNAKIGAMRCSNNLLCAKSKVAPVKSQTMPRLELCGALTLSRLLEKVLQAINIEFDHCYCWTDSTIVLGWLKQLPNQCKTFIGNRVSEIQNVTSKSDWRHVPSKHNAADILSLGMYPNDLQECHMWWHGPTFLLEEPSRWPNTQFDIPGLPEMKEPTRALLSFEKSEKFPFDRFPTLTKLKRTVAFMLRFKTNCFKQKFKRNVDGLTAEEVNTAYLCLIRLSQREMFPNEYSALHRGISVCKGRVVALNPFLDNKDIIRVCGRLGKVAWWH